MEMNNLIITKELKDIIGEINLKKLTLIYNEFKEKDLVKLSLQFKNSYENRNLIPSDYMIFFVNNLIENIYAIISEKIDYNLYCLEFVISYLFKIINSKFGFFPSYKLIVLIYYYLSNAINNSTFHNRLIKEYKKELNEDLLKCFEFFCTNFLKVDDDTSYNIKYSNKLITNIDGLMKLTKHYSAAPYLEFFIKFLHSSFVIKYYYILLIKFLKEYENTITTDDKIINLYSILNYLNINNESKVEEKILSEFGILKNTATRNLTNTSVKNILRYSLKILESNYVLDIQNIANAINYNAKQPVISNDFFKDKEYYKDLEETFYYYIKNINKPLKIMKYSEEKKCWCIIIKMLNILLDDTIIHNQIIKLILHFIIDLFNDKLDFRIEEDFISNIVNELLNNYLKTKLDIILYPEISFLLNNNKDIYDTFLTTDAEEEFYLELEKEIFSQCNANKFEYLNIKSVKSYKFRNIFIPFFWELLTDKKILLINIDSFEFYNFYIYEKQKNSKEYIFYLLYIYFNFCLKNKGYKFFNLQNKSIIDKNVESLMKELLHNKEFFILIKQIMKSKVMEEAYLLINEKDQEKNTKTNENKYNIFKYYETFCKEIDKYLNDDLFILMPLSKEFKAFTMRYLKIVINVCDIKFPKENSINDDHILLKSYLVFILIHELNHLIKRLNNIGEITEKASTPRDIEGGKEIISLLFENHLLNKHINLEQANYILDLSNWEKKTLKDFKDGYISISNEKKETSISFLYIGYSEICYNGFLRD